MIGKQIFRFQETDFSFTQEIYNSLQLHTWTTELDNMWINLAGNFLHKILEEYSTFVFDKDIADPKSYTATMILEKFKSLNLYNEADAFQKAILKLSDLSKNDGAKFIIISFYSNSTSDTVIASIEACADKISFGACLQGSEMN